MCKTCGKRFNEKAGTPFHWLHFSNEDVIVGTLLYANHPFSSYQVAEILTLNGINVSPSAIRSWVQRLSPHLDEISRHYKVEFIRIRYRDQKRMRRKFIYQIIVRDPNGNVITDFLAPGRITSAVKEIRKRGADKLRVLRDVTLRQDGTIRNLQK
ncbi:MAG: hypothetical protein U9M97_03220 [Candidatus Hadarchaeota archaeon]|nr:hypothetical protein [Candidatus Hadarchaeota archaeon]